MEVFDYDKIAVAITKYQQLSQKTLDIMSDLERIQKLLKEQVYWSGNASDYYIEQFESFLKNNTDFQIAMQNIPIYLQQINDNYKKMEQIL